MQTTRPLASTSLPWYESIRPARRTAPAASACIHTRFEARARREPGCVILTDETRSASYGDLCGAIDGCAAGLLRQCAAGARVGLPPGNRIDTIVAYLACLKAGMLAVSLPGPGTTPGRLAAASLHLDVTIVGGDGSPPPMSDIPVFRLDAGAVGAPAACPPRDAHRPAHILLTAGSTTGRPTAVMTTHVGSMLSHAWRVRRWPYRPNRDIVGCNIFGIWDLVPALWHGIPAVMLDDDTLRDPFALAAAIIRFGINRIMMTPTLLDACLCCEEGVSALRRLRLIVLCGEPVPAAMPPRLDRELPDVRVVNLYSLSECHDVAAGELRADAQPACGRVADFAEVHIVEETDRTRLVEAGCPGRVLVGGPALAHPCDSDGNGRFFEFDAAGLAPRRVFDTGDRGVLQRDGQLAIMGRCGGPHKVRGAWADPAEVGRFAAQLAAVSQVHVEAELDAHGHTRLAATVVPAADANRGRLPAHLRDALADALGPAAVPARIRLVDAIPLLPSGKLDRRALACTTAADPALSPSPGAGSTLDDLVLAVFRDVLENAEIDPWDAFDTVGGDSLRAVALCVELQQRTGRAVAVRDLRAHPTAAGMARSLRERPAARRAQAARLPELGEMPRPVAAPGRGVFVTGATGQLGRRLLRLLVQRTSRPVRVLIGAGDDEQAQARLDRLLHDEGLGAHAGGERIRAMAGNLGAPRLALTQAAFDALARQTGLVYHLGARVDMFASYAELEGVNVEGTREIIRLAGRAGARLRMVSSSAVLPLEASKAFDESARGTAFLNALAPRLAASSADGYSRSKFAAEHLVWQAFERGLTGSVVRVPHLLGVGTDGRLRATLRACVAAGVFPLGDGHWQVVSADAVAAHLSGACGTVAETGPLAHVALPPCPLADVADALRDRCGAALRRLPLPAFVQALGDAVRRGRLADGPRHAAIMSLHQLACEYGPRAALSLSDAVLTSATHVAGDAVALLMSEL